MASDGMWDHMSQSKAVQLVRGLDAEPAAAELVRWGGSVGMCGGGCVQVRAFMEASDLHGGRVRRV